MVPFECRLRLALVWESTRARSETSPDVASRTWASSVNKLSSAAVAVGFAADNNAKAIVPEGFVQKAMAPGCGAHHREGDGSRRQRTAHADSSCCRQWTASCRRWPPVVLHGEGSGCRWPCAHHEYDVRQRLLPSQGRWSHVAVHSEGGSCRRRCTSLRRRCSRRYMAWAVAANGVAHATDVVCGDC